MNNLEPPLHAPLINSDGKVSLMWAQYFDAVSKAIKRLDELEKQRANSTT